MSDNDVVGPPMIVATDALRAPKIRIGHIGGNISLPRTIPLTSLLAGGGTGLVGLTVAFIFTGGGIGPIMYGGGLGFAAGIFAVTWSPLRGESLAKWLGLSVKNRRGRIQLRGETVQLAVGIAVLQEASIGSVRIAAGAVNIPPSQYDERGVRIDSKSLFSKTLERSGRLEAPWLGTAGATQRLEDVEELWVGRTNQASVSRAIQEQRGMLQRQRATTKVRPATPADIPAASAYTPPVGAGGIGTGRSPLAAPLGQSSLGQSPLGQSSLNQPLLSQPPLGSPNSSPVPPTNSLPTSPPLVSPQGAPTPGGAPTGRRFGAPVFGSSSQSAATPSSSSSAPSERGDADVATHPSSGGSLDDLFATESTSSAAAKESGPVGEASTTSSSNTSSPSGWQRPAAE